jgi:UDP-2,4-diacetamido-2,4,6-trideoxy-beta-L-altropyranose hydrolase
MRIKFFTEGGKGIGFGHISRCLSLCQAFEEFSKECIFIVKGGEEVKEVIHVPLKLMDWVENLNSFEKELEDAQIVIVDSYLAKQEHYQIACAKAEKCLFVDDFNRLEYPCGYVLNGSVYAGELNYPIKNSVYYLLGTQYTPLRRAFWHVEKKDIGMQIERILITFGGDDAQNMTFRVVKHLEDVFPHIDKLVVIGSGFKNRSQILSLKSNKVRIYQNLSEEDMKTLMVLCDMAVSAGGQTTYELARVGLPSVLVAVAQNQLLNCLSWEKVGFALYAGWWEDDMLLDKIAKYIRSLEDANIRLKMSEVGRLLVDGQGARRVAYKMVNYPTL